MEFYLARGPSMLAIRLNLDFKLSVLVATVCETIATFSDVRET